MSDKITAKELIETFNEALEEIPFLVFEMGYNRVTGWMVQLWDASGTFIKDAPLAVSCQGDQTECFAEAVEKIHLYVAEKRD